MAGKQFNEFDLISGGLTTSGHYFLVQDVGGGLYERVTVADITGLIPIVSDTNAGFVPSTSGANVGNVASVKYDGTIEYVTHGGVIDSGTSFPSSPSTGDVFYRTDLRVICYYDGTRWVGDEMTIVFAPYNSLAYNISTTAIPFLTAIVIDMIITKASIALWGAAGTWDVSNYWTATFSLRDSTDSEAALDTVTVQTRPNWTVFDFDIEGTVIDAADQMMYVNLTPTGSPPNISAGFYFTARRIYT